MKFHVLEFATERSYSVLVTTCEDELNKVLARLNSLPKDTWALGEVEADDDHAAVAKVMAGNWEYSQEA